MAEGRQFTGRGRGRLVGRGVALAAVFLLALAFAASSGLASFRTGSYTGTTSQGRALSLDISKHKAHVTFFDMNIKCDDDVPRSASFAGISGKIKPSGKFTVKGPGDSGFVKGKIQGKKAEGTAKYDYKTASGLHCTALGLTWTAKRD